MGLFTKKKEGKGCHCGSSCTPERMAQAEFEKTSAGIKVLGSGCAKCRALEDATKAALEELHMDTAIDHVTDFAQIAGVWCDDHPCPCGRRQGGILWQGFEAGGSKSPHSEGQGMSDEPKTGRGVCLRPQSLQS